ncbi:MAG: hypothetical protein H8E33_04905 [Candidatus Cloacimonetes bacterium]|nr:hypothetical protein [Candidatus Cloacimonadota bacterium]
MKKIILILSCIFLAFQIQSAEIENSSQNFDSLLTFEKTKVEFDAFSLFFSGKILYHNKMYFHAIQCFEKYLSQNSDETYVPNSLFFIADSYKKLHLNFMTLTIFSELNDKFPTSKFGIWALKKIGDIYFSEEKYAKAKLSYSDFIYHNFDLSIKDSAFYQIERCNYHLGLYSYPSEIFTNFWKKFPHSKICPNLRFELGNYYFNIEKYSEANVEYENLIADFSELSWLDSVVYQLAESYFNKNDFVNTKKKLDYLLEKFPETQLRKKAYKLFLKSFSAEGDFLAAIDTLNSLIHLNFDEDKNEYYQQLADIYEKIGLHKELLDIYQIMLNNEEDEKAKKIIKEKIECIELNYFDNEDSLKILPENYKKLEKN